MCGVSSIDELCDDCEGSGSGEEEKREMNVSLNQC
jgi:hypothetical protein